MRWRTKSSQTSFRIFVSRILRLKLSNKRSRIESTRSRTVPSLKYPRLTSIKITLPLIMQVRIIYKTLQIIINCYSVKQVEAGMGQATEAEAIEIREVPILEVKFRRKKRTRLLRQMS